MGAIHRHSVFIGRWQCIPPHDGHIALIESVLKKEGRVLILIRKTSKDKQNPYSVKERRLSLKKAFKKWGDRVIVMGLPCDIDAICFGRKVGYSIKEIKLSDKLESISATEIRRKSKKLWQ